MKYIPDKKLYSAVMFALRMCPSLDCAYDSKVKKAAEYYHVNYSDVLPIVRRELWDRAISEAKKCSEWFTIFNPYAHDLLNTGWGNDYVFICPQCGTHYSCNVHDDRKTDKLYLSQCGCGFTDTFQRNVVRKDIFQHLDKGDTK